jgi:hypothetical protein
MLVQKPVATVFFQLFGQNALDRLTLLRYKRYHYGSRPIRARSIPMSNLLVNKAKSGSYTL